MAGAATIAVGLATHYHLVDKMEVGFTFTSQSQTQTQIRAEIDARMADIKPKIVNELRAYIESLIGKIQIDNKVELKAEIEAYIRKLSTLETKLLKQFTGFELGSFKLTDGMGKNASEICAWWSNHQDGFLLAIGATDRIPLSASAQLRYESNSGLARARAERVKSTIVECGVSSAKVLALVSGPRTTPERTIRPMPDTGVPEDRSVDVWAFWSRRDWP